MRAGKPIRLAWRHQRGAFAIILAGTLAALVLMVALVLDSGRLYLEKRSLQRVADMAVLEAVSRKGRCVDPDADNYAAKLVLQAATRNNLFSKGGELIGTECVDLVTNANGVREVAARNDASTTIRVTVGKTVPASLVIRTGCLFGLCASDTVFLQASAIAGREEPIAAFSVGSRLLRFDGASTLGGVLGVVGIDLDHTTLASYNGLANVAITPEGLLKTLGLPIAADMTVGDLNALLAAETVNVLDLLDAVATLAGEHQLLAANIELLQQLSVAAGVSDLEVEIPLLSDGSGSPGLFAEIVAPLAQSANAALGIQLNALDVIETALGIASHEHALTTQVSIPPLLGLLDVSIMVGVIEPPSIVIGGIGATAYSAQVRTFIHLKTGETISALNTFLSLLGTELLKIDLPIALDLISGKGVLEDATCTADADIDNTGRDHAQISVSGDVAKLCIGDPLDEDRLFSKYETCDEYMEGTKYLDVLGLVTLDRSHGSPLTFDVLPIAEESVNLSLDDTPLPVAWSRMKGRMDYATVGTNPLTVGDLVEDLLNLLLGESTIKYNTSENQKIAAEIWTNAEPPGPCPSGMAGIPCRSEKLQTIKEAASDPAHQGGLLIGLLSGLLGIVSGLLGLVGEILVGNGCTNAGLLGPLLNPPSDANCISKIAASLPGNSAPATNLGLGVLADILNNLGSLVLSPLLTDLLGLHISEVDVHLQDLNCGHAKLLR